jgi:hypothetical protein
MSKEPRFKKRGSHKYSPPASSAAGEFASRKVRKVELFFFLLSPAQRMIERDKWAEKGMTLSLRERDERKNSACGGELDML